MFPLRLYRHLVNMPFVDARFRTRWRYWHLLESIPRSRPTPPCVQFLSTEHERDPEMVGGEPGGKLILEGTGFCADQDPPPFVAFRFHTHASGKEVTVTCECTVLEFSATAVCVRIPEVAFDTVVADLVVQPQFLYSVPSFNQVFVQRLSGRSAATAAVSSTALHLSYPTGRLLLRRAFCMKGECFTLHLFLSPVVCSTSICFTFTLFFMCCRACHHQRDCTSINHGWPCSNTW